MKSKISPALIDQEHAVSSPILWHKEVIASLDSCLSDVGFPCVFSKRAFRKSIIKFLFVENMNDTGLCHLARGLLEFVHLSSDWDGDLDKAYPLIVAFSSSCISDGSIDEYHRFGWSVLQKLHEYDQGEWPRDVARDGEDPMWSMCFGGMPLFFNMSTPANKRRRSRNLGPNFIMVVNPRERFDIVAGDNPEGRKVRTTIRNRISRYDGQPYANQLGTYGENSLEWKQYGLIDENKDITETCPFRFVK
ncbi:YqcI/YcgG family protein [Pantoea agglomerans]|uniref:YqcI/YcgG family protein n=1 Tax=Enterobacter agglomerans TaxID=549 RepID=UPI003C7ADA6C